MREKESQCECVCEKREKERERVREAFSMELLLYPFGFFYCAKAERLYVNGVNTQRKNKNGFKTGFKDYGIGIKTLCMEKCA